MDGNGDSASEISNGISVHAKTTASNPRVPKRFNDILKASPRSGLEIAIDQLSTMMALICSQSRGSGI